MARPEIIARLHEAYYEFRIAEGAEKLVKEALYRELLKEAASQFGATIQEMEDVRKYDYAAWRRQEQLPPPSQKRD